MIKIDDFNRLSALHKAILAAKFATFPDPAYSEMMNSPILAGISNDIYDDMCRLQEKKMKGAGKDWQEWRRIKHPNAGFRRQWRVAVMTARRDKLFMSQSPQDRRINVKCLLSPFTCTEEEINLFLEEVEKGSGSQNVAELFKKNDLTGSTLFGSSFSDSTDTIGCAELVLGMKKGGSCDIFFGGVKKFSVTSDGENSTEELFTLRRHNVSTEKLQKLEAVFESGISKKHIIIESETVEYWV